MRRALRLARVAASGGALVAAALVAAPSSALAKQTLPQPPPIRSEKEAYRQSVDSLSLEKVAAGIFRMGSITVNKKERSISFPVQVNMDRGLLEYLLVRDNGKVHESLLRTTVEPYHLQIALLLLGLDVSSRPLAFQGAPEKPEGAGVELSLSFGTSGSDKKVLPEEWLVRKGGSDGVLHNPGSLSWIFTGSRVTEGRFLAQAEGSIISIFHDPVALIDNASSGGESDKIWFVREGTVPPPGTPATLTIKAI